MPRKKGLSENKGGDSVKIASEAVAHANKAIKLNGDLLEIIREQQEKLKIFAQGIIQLTDFCERHENHQAFILNNRDIIKEAQKFLAIRNNNRAAAKNRRPDALQTLIEQILTKKPSLTAKEALEILRQHEGKEVIDSINDAENIIEWHDTKHPAGDSPITGLKDRINRARKTIKSR